ncbi:MAG: hypothetical protein AAGH78_01030 [Cyanobacteria bacterium P01_H01_bin.58]
MALARVIAVTPHSAHIMTVHSAICFATGSFTILAIKINRVTSEPERSRYIRVATI